MEKIAFYTQTYCGEKFVRRAIESILNQTYPNFVYYISDDGSTDATPEIIMEYANKDARIVPCLSKVNDTMKLYTESINKIWEESGAKYFAVLDHDDEYAPDFAEKMVSGMEVSYAEMALCGSYMVRADTGESDPTRKFNRSGLINKSNKSAFFSSLFQFYRTMWGKVFKIDFLRKNHIQFRPVVEYGIDTIFSLDCSRFADQILFLQDVLHTHYSYNTSISTQYNSKRLEDDWTLFKEGTIYLEKIHGTTLENTNFLRCVYLAAIFDSIALLFNSTLQIEQRFDVFYETLTKKNFRNIWHNLIECPEAAKAKRDLLWVVMPALERIISIGTKYENRVFEIVCVFCPELDDFFDSSTIKPLFEFATVYEAVLNRNLEDAYKQIVQCDSGMVISDNRMIYDLKVYLSVVLHKDDVIIQEYLEQNQHKEDSLTKKRLCFITNSIKKEKGSVEVVKLDNQGFSLDSIRNFEELMDFVSSHSEEEILEYAFKIFFNDSEFSEVDAIEMRPTLYKQFLEGSFVGFFKSQFNGGALLIDTIRDIKLHDQDYIWLYHILEDEQSQKTLFYILMYRLFWNKEYLGLSFCDEIQYFASEIIPKREQHVFVDCGAFIGDSATDFIKYCSPDENYKKIYCYEPDPDNYYKAVESMRTYHDVVCLNRGVSSEKGQMRFTSHMPSAANRINPAGDKVVDIVDLDSDIQEAVTFIKMDIESAEPNALLGARRHIVQDRPMLAICVYHTVTDLLKIPQIIYEMNNNQKFYLRHHALNTPEEIVFYALPNEGPVKVPEKNNSALENMDPNDLLKKFEQLAELHGTVGESIAYIMEGLGQGNLDRVQEMMPLLQSALEQETSFVQNLRK